MDSNERTEYRGSWLPWVLAVLTIGLLGWHASTYLPFVADDSLISLRYAQRFLEGKGLTWTDGESVEGYSNLLWVLGVSALGALGIDLIVASRILGIAGMGAAIAAVFHMGRPLLLRDSPASVLPALALAGTGAFAVWTVGGLEQPMIAGFLAWAMVLGLPLVRSGGPDRVLGTGLCLAGLVLTRPDGPLFTAMMAAVIVAARGFDARAFVVAARMISIPFAAWVGQLIFRLAYYGDWVANTARVKVAFSSVRLEQGLAYVGGGLLWLGGLVALSILGLAAIADQRRRARVALIFVPLLVWLSYLAAVGGDIFPARRHLVPAVVLMSLLGVEGLSWLQARGRAWRWIGSIAGGLAVASLVFFQQKDPENIRAKHERWEWDGQVVGRLLKASFGEAAPLLAVDPAGCLPYFSELPSLDMLGLNDAWLPRNPPEGFGTGYLGHELGNGAYVLSREPDLLVFCGPRGGDNACFRGGRELMRNPAFRRQYLAVNFEGRDPYPYPSRIWVRREGGRIGLSRSEEKVEIPGFLFAGPTDVVARLDSEGRLGATVGGEAVGTLGLELPQGRWDVRAVSTGQPVKLTIKGNRKVLGQGRDQTSLMHPGGPIEVSLAAEDPRGGEAHIREVLLARRGEVEEASATSLPLLPGAD